MTWTKLETQILNMESMIDGVNIGIERAKELREKMLFQGEQETLGLDALIEILRKDKKELETAMKDLQKTITEDDRLRREALQESDALGDA